MMNVENDDAEPVTKLQPSLPQFCQCNQTRLSDSGAGVNAASRVDLAFVASDHLSELVWSPHYGLSIKCADSSFAESKLSREWNTSGLSHMAVSLPQGITSVGTSCEEHLKGEENSLSSQTALPMEGKFGEGASFVRSPRSISCTKPELGERHGYNEGISDNVEVQKVENTDRKDQCSPNNIQANFTAETTEHNAGTSAGQEKQITAFVKTDEFKDGMAQTEPLSSSEQNADVMLTDPSSRNEDFTLLNAEQNRNEVKDGFSGEPPSEKLESSAENDLQFLIGKQFLSEASPTNSGTHLNRRKRKEKALSDGHINEERSNDKENSHESVESCNSAGPTRLFSSRNGQEQLTVGNKKARKQAQVREGLGSTSFIGQDSSFMNWISNMVKGSNKTSPGASPLALTLANRNNNRKSTHLGFQSIFHSMCWSNTKEQQVTKMSYSPKTLSTNVVADPEACRISSCSDQNKDSINLVSSSVKEGNENIVSNSPSEAKVINPLRSVWIARFSAAKTPLPVLPSNSCDQNVNAALECSVDHARKLIPYTCNLIDQKNSEAKANSSEDLVCFTGKELQKYAPDTEASIGFERVIGNNAQKSTFKSNPSLISPKLKNSEAMASVFARRLDALKHIVSPDVEENPVREVSKCFYCGRSGHVLCDCLEVTEIERENLMRNQFLYDGAEESPCFCIKCFRLDHWAISCPVVSVTTHGHSPVPDARANCNGENYGPDIVKHVGLSSSLDNTVKEKLITPLCNLVKRKFSDMPEGVFSAIRNLRLSRMDVLKWMNSHTSSLQLDGFFLRLRLGKWEETIGGTGYHVACITGEQREKSQGSKKPISVNIGGTRCLIETQYISNQDFLEIFVQVLAIYSFQVLHFGDPKFTIIVTCKAHWSCTTFCGAVGDELMAWWCATQKSGGKVPSEDHLKLKFEERKMLGF